jgi:hypothetical protein
MELGRRTAEGGCPHMTVVAHMTVVVPGRLPRSLGGQREPASG